MRAAPLFVLSAPYSGAERVAALLDVHPQLCALPSLKLFMADRVGELLDIQQLGQGGVIDGLLRALAQLKFGAQSDGAVIAAREWLQQRAAEPVVTVLDTLAELAAPRRLVIPDAESPLRPNDLRRLREQVPDAQCIHLVRHPWSQGVIAADRLGDRLFVPADFKDHAMRPPLLDPQIVWLRAHRNLLDHLLAGLPAARARQLRWEELAVEPAATLAAIFEWLGEDRLPLSDAALGDAGWCFAGYGPAEAPYGLDHEMLEEIPERTLDDAFAAPSLDRPLPWRPDGLKFAAPVRALAGQFGYG
ncbi:MAG: sulfotransferase [Sinimarinibacterium sp.]